MHKHKAPIFFFDGIEKGVQKENWRIQLMSYTKYTLTGVKFLKENGLHLSA